jgi:HEAT repeat protein/V8-like Glu-specific endopeptidase
MLQIPKVLHSNFDYRYNLNQLEDLELSSGFIATIKNQAQSVACLVDEHFLKKREEGWQFGDDVPTLAQQQEKNPEFKKAAFGENEAFRDEVAAGFGTAFLVGKDLALTAAHCICKANSNELNTKLINATRLVFGFHEVKEKPSDYFFRKDQVYRVSVATYQYFRSPGRHTVFSEWTDWAILKLDKETTYPPLSLNLTEKIANNIELYMLGHPNGLPLKFTYNGRVKGNSENDFFDCDLDAFAGNSGSFVGSKSSYQVVGILCDGTKDYETTQDYQGTGETRIQACHITQSMIGQNKIGNRLENCQRMDVLRHLLDEGLLGLEGIERQENAAELIIQSLREYYKSRDTIPRLLDHALPIDEIYTELVLICQNNEKEDKKEAKTFEEHRINSWEDIHTSKEPIELPSLFNNKEGKHQKHLIILGRAGIGKSILCQHIAHQWAVGKLWKEKFDAIFWIPLRKLKNVHSAETASSFIYRTCCKEQGKELYVPDIRDYLKHNAERVLFVLDGLDEVTLEENSPQRSIVNELLAFPHWILTSRPHAIGPLQADSTIENVGFASKTIKLYIQKSFQENAQTVIQKLRQNPIIFGLCHIPINLELVCSILKKSKTDISSITSITGLYETITWTLQKRFLEIIGRPEAWEWRPGELERNPCTQPLFELLELIAWTGMQERQLLFSFNTKKMENIYYKCELDKRDELFTQICKSGFLQSTGDSEDILSNEYSFLHLTFQEFFSARYLVRLLETKPVEAAKCIKAVKFDPRYKVVMWFTAGLLRNEGGNFENLNAFFEILDTPKDCIGFYSALLKVRCLEECGWQERLQKLKLYEQEIQFWCGKIALEPLLNSMLQHLVDAFEISPQGAKRFLIPQLGFCLLSENAMYWNKSKAVKALGQVGQADPRVVLPLLIEAFKEEDVGTGTTAAQALGKIVHADPQFALPLLTKALKDKYSPGRESAAQALGKIGHADPQFTLPFLAEALKDETSSVRKEAVIALSKIGQADPQFVLPLLAKALKDETSWVRSTAAEALGEIGHTDPQFILPLLAFALKDKAWAVRGRAAKALGEIGHAYPQFVLIPLLDVVLINDDSRIIENATKAYGEIGRADPQFALLRPYSCSVVREIATKALGQIGRADPQLVLPLLVEALKDKDRDVSPLREVLGKISQANPQLVLPLLVKILKDEDSNARQSAVMAFGAIGHDDPQFVLSLLAVALKDKNRGVRGEVAIALGKIGRADPQLVLPLLAVAIKDNDSWVRSTAAGALGKIGRADPQFVLPLLAAAIKDNDSWVRSTAAGALGKIGRADPQLVLPLLAIAFKDENQYVRKEATKTLGKIGHRHTDPLFGLPLLVIALKDKNTEVRNEGAIALVKMGHSDPQFVPLLTHAFKDGGWDSQRIVLIALGEIGHANPQLVLPLLVKISKDKDWYFRKIAVKAFKKYDLASCLKFNPNLLHDFSQDTNLFISTPLSSLIKCYKEDLSHQSLYIAAITLKCIEENISFFQEDDAICFYEQGKLCKMQFQDASQCMALIKQHILQYPQCILNPPQSTSTICSIQ